MININYHPIITSQIYEKRGILHPLFADGVYIEPKRLIDEDSTHAKLEYYHCPAWRHTASNTFVFYNQMDIDFSYNTENKQMIANNVKQEHWDEFIGVDPNFLPTTNTLVAQIGFGAIFWCDDRDDLWLNQQPFWNLSEKSGVQLIGASMPIGVWSRPVNIALRSDSNKITISRGQPMFTINFNDLKENYRLIKKEPTEKFVDKVRQYIDVKNYLPRMSWNLIKRKMK
jgi:hypothetical protein